MPTTLDPRMIESSQPLTVDSSVIRSLTSTNIRTTGLSSATLSAVNITANNVTITNLTATGNTVTYFSILTGNANYTFSNSDNSKVFHFDTTTTPQLTARFPNTISNGFNVSIVNAGTGVVYISSGNTFNAVSNQNSVQYTGMFIYKVNNQLYGVGVFE